MLQLIVALILISSAAFAETAEVDDVAEVAEVADKPATQLPKKQTVAPPEKPVPDEVADAEPAVPEKKPEVTKQAETLKQSDVVKGPEPKRNKTLVGFDGGLSADLVVSDKQTGVFGAGMGKHFGAYGSFFADRSTGLKVRLDYLNLEQQILSSKPQPSVIANGYLKTLQQNYWLLSAGAEFRNEGLFGRQFFWEAALGYAFGQPSQYTVLVKQTNDEIHAGHVTPASGPVLGLGMGFRRQFREKWMATFALRSVLSYQGAFGEPFTGEMYVPVPFLFSFGVERGF